MIATLFGVSFLTPLAGVFAVAIAAPLAALLFTERRSEHVRKVLGLRGPGRRAFVPVVIAIALLPALVAVAAAQPVVVRQHAVKQRGDAQAIFVIDTSLSMQAQLAPGQPTRIMRARRLARLLAASLPDVPVGLAGMTDRVLPFLMPTTDPTLLRRTLVQSVGIDEPPPSQQYNHDRATNLQALIPVLNAHFFSTAVAHKLLVVFTDGEASSDLTLLGYGVNRQIKPIFVHVWERGERIYHHGKPDPYYVEDPASTHTLEHAAAVTGGYSYGENELATIESRARRLVGSGTLESQTDAYARIALAPWVALGGVLPLGFLLYRRNF
ncbi:MAG: VWA domain-containing protein [Actinobacteria bacterium]|nr:VWA domain-containing protein [Actinomycetota bacterium]